MDIEGKSALVLGGAGLVGRAVAIELLQAGAGRLVVAARRESSARAAATQAPPINARAAA